MEQEQAAYIEEYAWSDIGSKEIGPYDAQGIAEQYETDGMDLEEALFCEGYLEA